MALESMAPVFTNKPAITAGAGLAMFEPTAEVKSICTTAQAFEDSICEVVCKLETDARKRGKRKATLTEIAPDAKKTK